MPWRLDPRCELGVLAELPRAGQEHEDLGCGLQGPASRAVRRALDPLRRRIQRMGEQLSLIHIWEPSSFTKLSTAEALDLLRC